MYFCTQQWGIIISCKIPHLDSFMCLVLLIGVLLGKTEEKKMKKENDSHHRH